MNELELYYFDIFFASTLFSMFEANLVTVTTLSLYSPKNRCIYPRVQHAQRMSGTPAIMPGDESRKLRRVHMQDSLLATNALKSTHHYMSRHISEVAEASPHHRLIVIIRLLHQATGHMTCALILPAQFCSYGNTVLEHADQRIPVAPRRRPRRLGCGKDRMKSEWRS